MKTSRRIILLSCVLSLIGSLPLLAEEKRPVVAIVLEGGSAWGFAHIGVLKVIEELGIPVDIVVGTSMGSIVGGFYASGYTVKEIEDISIHAEWADLLIEDNGKANLSCRESIDRATWSSGFEFDRKGFSISGGLVSGKKVLRFFDSFLAGTQSTTDFDEFPRRFRAVATDVSNGERIVYSKGSLSDAMRASMSIPGVFEPHFYEGKYLVDGGVVDNLPVDIARDMGADIIIAVDLYYGKPIDPESLNRTPIVSLARSLDLLMRTTVKRQLPLADLIIPINMESFLPTDFVKAGELAALGETTARAEIARLAAIKERLTAAGRDSGEVRKPVLPPVNRIIVKGVTGKESDQVRKLFMPLLGTGAEEERFREIFASLDRSDKYDLVRVARDGADPDCPLVVTVRKKPAGKSEVKLGVLTESTFSSAVTGNLDILTAVILRGLTTPNSQLRMEGEMLDTPDFKVSFVQPVDGLFSVTPFYSYQRDSTTRIGDTSFVIQYQTAAHSAGLSTDFAPVAGIDWSLGWRFDWITEQYIPSVRTNTDVDSASLLETGLSVRKLDSPVFPMDGISAHIGYILSLRQFGSERFFRVLETDGSTFLSLDTPFSVAFLWKGGTDFSTSGDDPNAAPPFYKPSLANRRMFPGPLAAAEEIGNHVAGAALELKHNLNWNSRGITLPVFLIVHASIGAVIQNPSATDWKNDVFHGNAAAGIGLRVNDGFGIEFRGGIQRNIESKIIPFIALDFGAIGLQ